MFLAVKFKAYPDKTQKQLFEQNCGNTRFVYNWALDLCVKAYKRTGKTLSFFDLCSSLVSLKKKAKYSWLTLTPANSLLNSLQDLSQAYKNMFSNVKAGRSLGHPVFKSKHDRRQSFRISKRLDYVDEGYIKLETIGWVKVRNTHGLERLSKGKIKSVTISKDSCGYWYASALLDVPDFTHDIEHTYESCGVDLGIKSPVVISKSNGNFAVKGKEFSCKLSKIEKRRKKAQKSFARKQKSSKNRAKQKLRVAKLYRKETNVRKDWIEKTSHYLVSNYREIRFEALNLQKMTKKDGEYKKKINDGMRRLGLGYLVQRTVAKAKLYSSTIIFVDPKNTSRRCSSCGKIDKASRISQSKFECTSCDYTQHADKNAASNIRLWAKIVPSRGREFKPV